MKSRVIFLLISLVVCSCTVHETFIIQGHIRDVKDSITVILYQTIDPIAGLGVGIAEDTLCGGNFKFEFSVAGESDRYNINFFDGKTFVDGMAFYAEPGKDAYVSGRGCICATYKVRSKVKKQHEWNSYQKWIRKESIMTRLASSKSERDSLLHERDLKALSYLERKKVTDTWMWVFLSCSKTKDECIKEKLRSLLDGLSEDQLENDFIVNASKRLFAVAPLSVGDIVPEIMFRDIDGQHWKLSSFKGRKVMLVFSQIGCAPCYKSRSEIIELCRVLPDDFMVIYVNVNDYEVWKSEANYLNDGVTKILEFNDDSGETGIYSRFKKTCSPTFVLLDEDLRIVNIWYGYRPGIITSYITAQSAT